MKGRIGFTIDQNLRIVSWGKKISEITGQPPNSVKGQYYYEVIPRLSLNGSEDLIKKAIQERKIVKIKNFTFRCLNGFQSADISIKPSKNNRVSVSLCIKNNCKYKEKLNSCERLIDMGKHASTLAHGVRTPLNAIKGAVVYLKNRYPDEKPLLEFIDIIEEEIGKLDNFVSKFLTGVMNPEGEIVDLDLNQLIKKLEPYTLIPRETKKIDIEFIYNKIPVVQVDPFHIEHAILNLLNNAIEAVDEDGKIKLQTFTQIHGNKKFAVVEISDNGPGFSKNIGSYGDIPEKGQSHGFGLFLTREIVQFYKGSIEIKSLKGEGTVVKILLPEKQGD